ncbi:MAG: M48 family metallopeptidase [bacterium]|nr:M48 family metallopeptidase [bacterium]
MKRITCILIVLLAIPLGLDAQTVRALEPGCEIPSLAEEKSMGEAYVTRFERETPLLRNEVIEAYLRHLVSRLAETSPIKNPGQTYTILIVDAYDVQAYAYPGGFLYITSQLLRAAESEVELAGIVAHEIGHVLLHHGTCEMKRRQEMLDAFLNKFPEEERPYVNPYWVIHVIESLHNVEMQVASRIHEQEADLFSIRMLLHARYDADMYLRGFERMLDGEKNERDPEYLRSHPASDRRIETMKKEARTYASLLNIRKGDPRRAPINSEFATMKKTLENILEHPSQP